MEEMKRLIEKCDKSCVEDLKRSLSGAPDWLLEAFQVISVEAGSTFISEGEKAQKIFILIKGRVTAVDYRVRETAYNYFEYTPLEVLGALEILVGQENYMTSLVAAKNCVFLKISRDLFEKWLNMDIRAFRMLTKEVSRRLIREARRERLNVLLKAKERIAMILIRKYEGSPEAEKLQMYLSRKEIMDITGLSERTVTRTLKEFETNGEITRSGWDIVLTREQYLNLRELVDDKLSKMGE